MTTETNTLQVQNKEEVQTTNGVERTHTRKLYTPRVNIYETNDDFQIVADMPGVDENSIDITVEKNVLTIQGSVDYNSPDNYSLAYAEYGIGDYQRSFTISNEIDQENIEATVKNGVLSLRLPKAATLKTKKIAVRAA